MIENIPKPRLIAFEVTGRCKFNCRHCRAASERGPYADELGLDEIRRVLDNIAAHYRPIIILTGGEPMLRPDLEEIVRHTVSRGLRPVLATCGAMLDEARAAELKSWGIERISLSIDGADAERHDAFRGTPGAFEAAMAALEAARRAGLPFQINTTISRLNVDQLEPILDLAVSEGAVAFHPFLLVPTGRGEELRDQELDAEEYERVLHRIYELQREAGIPFKPTCAPHYYRVLRQREADEGREVTPGTHGLDAMSKGCMGGISFAFISHVGKVQICGFLEVEAGDLRQSDYDFAAIWEKAPLFRELRDYRNYKGDCGICEYRRWCGGCRARAYAASGDYLAEEPYCAFVPGERRAAGDGLPGGEEGRA